MRMRRVILGMAMVTLIAAACAETPEVVVLPDYASQVAELPPPPNDRSLPDVSPKNRACPWRRSFAGAWTRS